MPALQTDQFCYPAPLDKNRACDTPPEKFSGYITFLTQTYEVHFCYNAFIILLK